MFVPGSHDICSKCCVCELFLCVKIWISIQMYVSIVTLHWLRFNLPQCTPTNIYLNVTINHYKSTLIYDEHSR